MIIRKKKVTIWISFKPVKSVPKVVNFVLKTTVKFANRICIYTNSNVFVTKVTIKIKINVLNVKLIVQFVII